MIENLIVETSSESKAYIFKPLAMFYHISSIVLVHLKEEKDTNIKTVNLSRYIWTTPPGKIKGSGVVWISGYTMVLMYN